MKAQILKALRSQAGVISGEELSTALGVSRVSVWKHIQKLREFGYKIVSSPKGYRIVEPNDFLYAWEFAEREPRIAYFAEISSTMDIAKDMARKGCPDYTVVIAGCQNKGRGRLQRTWLSDEGGLYFTIVLRPAIAVVLSPRLNFLASSTLAQVIREGFDVDARVKWPNDILVDGRKICGMLSEMEAEGDQVTFINIGMGINVNNDPSLKEAGATSLKKLLGRDLSRRDLLVRFLDLFEKNVNTADYDGIIDNWKKNTITLNKKVRIVTTHEETEGTAVDVDDNGALILKLPDGSIKKIIYGDCFINP
jgi:BirA family biotin operon repressor/biotin-[acetyl-CoA-carboxylase] ligase